MNKNKVIVGLSVVVLILLIIIVLDVSSIRKSNTKEYSTEIISSVEGSTILKDPTINPEYTQGTEALPDSKFDLSKFSEPDQFAIKDIASYKARELGYSDTKDVIISNVEIKDNIIIISFDIEGITYKETRTYPKFNPIK